MKGLSWLVAILVFGLLIFIHEMGHYITARLFHVKIFEFSIGMGPKMLTYTAKKTGIKYSLGIFPFGGYVSMAGEDGETDEPDALSKKAPWKRFIIVAAGAFMNLFLGFALIFTMIAALPNLQNTTIAQYPSDEWYAENDIVSSAEFGLQEGDTIVSINGTRVYTGYDLSYEIMHDGVEPCRVVVFRDGQEVVLEGVKFPVASADGIGFGVTDFNVGTDDKNLLSVLRHSAVRSFTTVKMVFESIGDLFRGRYGVEAVSGPIGVAGMISEAASSNVWEVVLLAAVISINLGLMNLLPVPALDGGRLVFILIEMIFRRPVPAKYEAIVNFAGFVLLMALMVLILFKDIFALFA